MVIPPVLKTGARKGLQVRVLSPPLMKNQLNGLAKERNLLANERTLLAYLRTGLACWGVGILVIKFFNNQIILYLGTGFFLAGLVLFLIGFKRFLVYRRKV